MDAKKFRGGLHPARASCRARFEHLQGSAESKSPAAEMPLMAAQISCIVSPHIWLPGPLHWIWLSLNSVGRANSFLQSSVSFSQGKPSRCHVFLWVCWKSLRRAGFFSSCHHSWKAGVTVRSDDIAFPSSAWGSQKTVIFRPLSWSSGYQRIPEYLNKGPRRITSHVKGAWNHLLVFPKWEK